MEQGFGLKTVAFIMANYKAPPVLRDVDSYLTWKKEIQLWKTFMDLIPRKQASAICMSLARRACEAALQLSVETLNSDEGKTELMKALDSLYLKDKDQLIYEAYDNFEKFIWPAHMNMSDYLNESECLNIKLKEYKKDLPERWRTVDSKVPRERTVTAKATLTELTYVGMKKQL